MQNFLVPLALFGWIPAVIVAYAMLPRRTAIIGAFLGAWMFLPVAGYRLSGLPDFTKVTATCAGVMLCLVLLDSRLLATFRFRWFDIPMVVWCVAPFLSAISAGFGAYEGASGVLTQTMAWGVPYFVGRVVFADPAGMKALAIGLVIGGLVYIPFCLWEIRMSPHLHKWVYGYHQQTFRQARRMGGFRPMVFMQHGLAVGMFMSMATLVAFGLWQGKTVRRLRGVPMSWVFGALLVVAVLCKSTGAIGLLLMGLGIVLAVKYTRLRLVLAVVLCMPLMYMGARTVGGWDGKELMDAAYRIAPERAQSLQFRLNSEQGVWALTKGDRMFGWSRFSFREEGGSHSNDQRIVGDGLWVTTLGKFGLVGLVTLATMFVLPPFMLFRAWKGNMWCNPVVMPAFALAVVITLTLFDNLFNAMHNPYFVVAMGGLAGCCGTPAASRVPGGQNLVAARRSIATARTRATL